MLLTTGNLILGVENEEISYLPACELLLHGLREHGAINEGVSGCFLCEFNIEVLRV